LPRLLKLAVTYGYEGTCCVLLSKELSSASRGGLFWCRLHQNSPPLLAMQICCKFIPLYMADSGMNNNNFQQCRREVHACFAFDKLSKIGAKVGNVVW